MKRWICVILALALCLPLCACGSLPTAVPGKPTEAPVAQDPTEPPTEPIPDITVTAIVPSDWQNPGCWAWVDGGADAFAAWPGESMTPAADGSYTVTVPGWVDHVIINGNGGSVQTADLSVETGEDLWVHVVNPEYAFVHYVKPIKEVLEEELSRPAAEYHENVSYTFFRGGYQIQDTKFVTYNANREERYTTDYIPEELQAKDPKDIYYVVELVSANKQVGFYLGTASKAAIQPGIKIKIYEVATQKVVMESEAFMGTEPPQTISSNHSGWGEEPDEALIEGWILSALESISAKNPSAMPELPLNEEALTEEEKAAAALEERVGEGRELALRLGLSHDYLIEWLVEYEDYTQEEAVFVADNCGLDWKEVALMEARNIMAEGGSNYMGYPSHVGLVNDLMTYNKFTKEEAVYAADNCGADWKEQALREAQRMLDDENELGYSKRTLKGTLADKLANFGKAFTPEEVEYAMNNIRADWGEQAVKYANFILEYYPAINTKVAMRSELVNMGGFTEEEAKYAVEKLDLD